MAIVSIDLDAMQALVDALDTATRTIPDQVDRISRGLDHVWLSCPELSRWKAAGSGIWQLTELRAECQRRLDKAREIAGSSPSIRQVPVDETRLGQDDATLAISLLQSYEYGQDVPQALLDLLAAHDDDPVFAAALAQKLDPADLAWFVAGLSQTSEAPADPLGLVPQIPRREFLDRYAQLLDCLGQSLSRGASSLDPAGLEAMTQRWASTIEGAPASGTPLALVLSRGLWPSGFLGGVQQAVARVEAGFGSSLGNLIEPGRRCDVWLRSGAPVVIDPSRLGSDGRPARVTDPMYGLFWAGAANPEWFSATYGNGQTVDVTFDGDSGPVTRSVNAALADLFRQRGFGDEATVLALLQAASITESWQFVNSKESSVPGDVEAIVGSIQRDQALHDALPWYQKYSHEILRGIAAITGLAAVFVPGPGWMAGGLTVASFGAAGVDIGLSVSEGDYRSAAISGLFLLPVAVGGVFKFVRLTRAELTLLRDGNGITLSDGTVLRLENGRLRLADGDPIATNADGAFKSPPDLVVKTRIDEIRQTLPSDLKKSGNMAVADVTIPGLPTEFKAFSQVQTASNKGALAADGTDRGFSYLKPADQRLLHGYQSVKGYDRSVDTEAKILEDIASRTQPSTQGSVVLYTQLTPCPSCQAIIEDFRRIRPNITLIVLYTKE